MNLDNNQFPMARILLFSNNLPLSNELLTYLSYPTYPLNILTSKKSDKWIMELSRFCFIIHMFIAYLLKKEPKARKLQGACEQFRWVL